MPLTRKIKLYLDTSVWNFLLAEDVPEERWWTKLLFEKIEAGKYESFISAVVSKEIEKAPDPKKTQLNNLIERYHPILLEETDKSVRLAEAYLKAGILSGKQRFDLDHIAVAVVHQVDVVVSWNMEHIVKVGTRLEVNRVNLKQGYPRLELCTPREVI